MTAVAYDTTLTDTVISEPVPGKCNHPKVDGTGLCKQPAGFHTDHVGYGCCKYHSGMSPSHRAHARETAAQAAVLRLAGSDAQPVRDPVETLSRLVGNMRADYQAASQLVADMYATGTLRNREGTDLDPLVKLWERTRDAFARNLSDMAKLGIEERRIEIDQATQQALYATLTAVLTDAGYDPGRVLPELGSRLRALDTGGTER